MTHSAKARAERKIIIEQPEKRPYGARLRIRVRSAATFGGAGGVGVSLPDGRMLTIEPTHKAPWLGGENYVLVVEAFPTAKLAEEAGRQLLQAVLWMAVSTDVPVHPEYSTHEPASVFERNRSRGVESHGYGEVSYRADIVLAELAEGYGTAPTDDRLLLSMEIFCSAGLETSARARFLAVISALEPLAGDAPLGPDESALVDQWVQDLEKTDLPAQSKASLRGRLGHLRHESIGSGIRRIVRETFPEEPNVANEVRDAYELRSQIVHSGCASDPDVDLDQQAVRMSAILRSLYARRLGRPLRKTPPQ